MANYKTVTLMHGILNRPVEIVASTIVGFMYSETTECTIVFCMGQVNFPAKETSEEIKLKLTQAMLPITKESK